MEFRVLTKQMDLFPYQQLYFTTLDYDDLRPLFPKEANVNVDSLESLKGKNVFLLTGIASPTQLIVDLEPFAESIHPLSFSDHHNFKKKDIRRINEEFASLQSPKVIVTTEKDATRLQDLEGLSDEVRKSLYVLPVKVSFMLEGEVSFNEKIIGYVLKNSRNSILAKGKDDHKSENSDSTGNRPRTISFRNNGQD
jgi:tetraacyldisaccharide 4'-kinase